MCTHACAVKRETKPPHPYNKIRLKRFEMRLHHMPHSKYTFCAYHDGLIFSLVEVYKPALRTLQQVPLAPFHKQVKYAFPRSDPALAPATQLATKLDPHVFFVSTRTFFLGEA